MSGHARRAIAMSLVAALGAGCFATGPSELDVHNRTTSAITWTELNRTNGVLACGSVTFVWNSGWEPKGGDEDIDRALTGVPLAMAVAPIGDANVRIATIVTSDGIKTTARSEVDALPPCEGQPPGD